VEIDNVIDDGALTFLSGERKGLMSSLYTAHVRKNTRTAITTDTMSASANNLHMMLVRHQPANAIMDFSLNEPLHADKFTESIKTSDRIKMEVIVTRHFSKQVH
jgi:hypothetical protein